MRRVWKTELSTKTYIKEVHAVINMIKARHCELWKKKEGLRGKERGVFGRLGHEMGTKGSKRGEE